MLDNAIQITRNLNHELYKRLVHCVMALARHPQIPNNIRFDLDELNAWSKEDCSADLFMQFEYWYRGQKLYHRCAKTVDRAYTMLCICEPDRDFYEYTAAFDLWSRGGAKRLQMHYDFSDEFTAFADQQFVKTIEGWLKRLSA